MMLLKRLAYLLPWRRRAAEQEIDDELRSIAEMAQPGELGNLTLAAEDARSELGWTRLEQVYQDLRYASRATLRTPAFTIAAVASLAIGIGVNVTLFSLIDTLLWQALPVRDPATLLALGRQNASSVEYGFTYGNYEVFREHVPALDVAAYGSVPLSVSISGELEPTLQGQLVSGSYFRLLGVTPIVGRLLDASDDRVPRGHHVAVLSHRYWTRRFGADAAVVGRTVAISGQPFTIVGVAPRDFFGTQVGAAPDFFLPIMMQPVVMPMTTDLIARDTTLTSLWLRVLARVAPDASQPRATAQLQALVGTPETDWRLTHKFTRQVEDAHLVLLPAATGLSDLRRQFSQPLFLLLGISGIVLLIACANVGNLVLARAATRHGEFALRLALGASRGRIVRQVMAESAVIAIPAGLAALALAYWTAQALVGYAAIGRDALVLDVTPGWRELAFSLVLSIVAGLTLGCLPALRASRSRGRVAGSLAVSRVRGAGSAGPGQGLVVLQIALSMVLLVGAALFVRSLHSLTRFDQHVDQLSVLIIRIEPRGSGDRHAAGVAEALDRTYRDLITRLEALPGVRSASLARSSPLTPTGFGYRLLRPSAAAAEMVAGSILYPRYFSTMGIPIVRGRDFDDSDLRPGAPAAVIVNEAFVRSVLGHAAPLGTAHGVSVVSRTHRAPMNIVGVVRDSRFPDLRDGPQPTVYQPFLQANTGFGGMTLHVRLADLDEATIDRIRVAVQAVQPDVPLFQVHSLAEEVDAALVRERLLATLTTVFGMVALTLICVGLYGLMAFGVARRMGEIGVRVAIGATPSDIGLLVAHQALRVLGLGLAVGLPAAWLTSRMMSAYVAPLLYGVTPGDPLAFAAAAALLTMVALVAGVVPILRATRVDPIIALHHD